MTQTRSGCLKPLLGLLGLGLLLGVVRYYGGAWLDRYQRPWAFSTTEPRLVGSWTGNFTDPDGIRKTLTLRIDSPLDESSRWSKAFRRPRRHSRTNNRAFDGAATVVSRRGTEQYEAWGAISRDDDHGFSLNTRVVDEKTQLLPNFALGTVRKAQWQGDKITFTLGFNYRRADGSSHWDSADPRFSRLVPVTLTRQPD